MRRMISIFVAFLAGCGANAGDPQGTTPTASDPAGQRAFFGAFQMDAATPGTCAFIVTPTGAASARCVAGSTTATLSGTYSGALASPVAAAPGLASAPTASGTGTVALSGTVNGVAWSFQGSIPAPGLPAASRDTLGGTLVAGGVPVAVVAADSTVDPAKAFCGSYTGSDTGTWLLQVGSSTASGVVFVGPGDAAPLAGTRNGTALTLTAYDPTTRAPAVTATGSVGATSVQGTWSGLPGTGIGSGSWSGDLCPGSNSYVCCGSGASTQCLFAATCPAPGATVQGACTFSSAGFTECDQYSGYASTTDAQASCASPAVAGTWGTTACPAAGRLGTCTTSTGGGSTFSQSYYTGTPASLLAAIQANCTRAGGSWTSGG